MHPPISVTRYTDQPLSQNWNTAVQSGTPVNSTDKSSLESVQTFAGRVISGKWKDDYPTLLRSLNWKTLAASRTIQKLKVCFNIINSLSCIPSHLFIPHPHPSPLKTSFQTFSWHACLQIFLFCRYLLYSHWNPLPDFIVNSSSSFSVKSKLHHHFSTWFLKPN